MSTLTDVIRTAAGTHSSIGDVLRQCLILAYELDNEPLKTWIDRELNGYSDAEEVPQYRRVGITAKGVFVGSFGRVINDQPLASHVMKPEHRHWAERSILMQPIVAYEEFTRDRKKKRGNRAS